MRKEKSDLTLTEKDKAYLLEMDVPAEDFRQIEEVALPKYTRYTLYENESERGKRISRAEAIRLLGRRTWLSGLSRSAFHYSACRNIEGGQSFILFDSSRYFKD